MTVEELAEAVARAVLECDHVVRLGGGAATYLPGRLISGVAVRERPPEIEVRVVVPWGVTVSEVSDEVRAAVRRIAPAVPLTLVIDDLDIDSDRSDRRL